VTDDTTLLQRYAANRDEEAFAEVVRRHLPFVYSAALRRLGRDTHHAQDVAQVVFCALARDARSIARSPVLSGWLYTATRNAVINVVRSEKRRRTREEEAYHMQQMESESAASADWSKLRPVLDSAMDRLSARDREAVLLRFFQGRSFGEIGAIVGLSEDAARKRIDRALAKLRDILRPHGVAPTSTALAALLASQPVAAAPAGLLASVTGAALSTGGAAAIGAVTFITMTKLQAGIAAAILVAGAVSLITQQRTISQLREETAVTQERLARLDPENATAGKPRGSVAAEAAKAGLTATASVADATRPPPTRGEMLARTSAALQNGKLPEGYFAFAGVLQQLTRDNWREVLRGFDEERKRAGLGHPKLVEVFVRRAGEVAGLDAVNYFLKGGWGGDASEGMISWASNEAMIGWASKNPAEALQWLGRDADPEARRRFMGAAIRGLALTEPDLAVKTLEEQPAKERGKYTNELVTSALRSVGIDGALQLVEGMITRAAENGRLKEGYLRNVVYDYSSMRIYQAMASGTVSDALNWMNQHVGQPYFDHAVIAEVTRRFTVDNPQAAFRWLEGVNTTLLRAGDTGTAGYRTLLDAWKAKEGVQVVETWLQAQTSHPHYDQIAWQYAALVVEQDPNKALKWANTIKDPKIKQEVMRVISQRPPRGKS
jgi:RNA polymerase sigma factor (sigma-70 family)